MRGTYFEGGVAAGGDSIDDGLEFDEHEFESKLLGFRFDHRNNY